jgi:hypothetical protein
MSPLDLFFYILAVGVALFAWYLLALIGVFLFFAGRGWLADDGKKS